MGRLTILFYLFVIVVLSLFGTFLYLMTTVNPGHQTALHGAAMATEEPTTAQETTTATNTETASKRAGLMKLLDYNEEERPSDISKTMNLTDPKKSKGRRSIDHRRKKKSGVVIIKIVDSEGKPRIEIVFYPNSSSNEWKKYKRRNALGPKRPQTDLLGYSILNMMPDDSIVFENKDISYNRDSEPEFTISADVSDKTKTTEEVFDAKNTSSILTNPPDHGETVTKLITVLPSQLHTMKDTLLENVHENVTLKMEIDTNSKEKQTEAYTEILVEDTDNFLHSTNPDFNTINTNIEDFGINRTESSFGMVIINHNDEATEQNTILLSPAQDTSIENPLANATIEMNMNFSEELHTVSHEDVSNNYTDNLLHSINQNFNTTRSNKEIRIDENESKTDIFDSEDQGIFFTTSSNLNNGSGTKPNDNLTSVQNTSAIVVSHENFAIAMEMNFSEEMQINFSDNLFHSTGKNVTTVSFIKEDIETDNNKSYADVFDTKDLGTILTTLNYDERETKLNPILMSPAEDTSPMESENATLKMNFSEQLQTTSYEDASVKDTDNILNSTSTNVNIVT